MAVPLLSYQLKGNAMLRKLLLSAMILVLFLIVTRTFATVNDWTHLANSPAGNSIALDGPNTIDMSTLQWIAWQDPTAPEYYIEFQGPANPAVFNDKVYVYAKVFDANDNYSNSQIICFDDSNGQTLWHTIIDMAVMDSRPCPVVDAKNNTVLIGSGQKLFALDADSGDIVWSTQLQKYIVTASPCIADDITPLRAFITDYDGQGSTGKLYCVNLDPNDLEVNPFEPGEIVWTDTLGGTSGNTPAYKDGVVYVSSVVDSSGAWSATDPGGTVFAYDATEPNAVQLWKTKDPRFEGFFGGVSLTNDGYLYAANYDFYGQGDNSALCKIDCDDGIIIWVAQTERTDSIPILVDDMIYICGGIEGFGSRSKLQAFQDMGSFAQKVWETPSDMTIGGWTHQPVYANGKLYIGAMQTGEGFFAPYDDLYILDAAKSPHETGFIIDHYKGCGNSPAVTHDSIYTIGYDGLHKFHQSSLAADIDNDSTIDHTDLLAIAANWLSNEPIGVSRTDLNLDGCTNFFDYTILAEKWLKNLH